MADKIMHAKGAENYFAECGKTDNWGGPVIVGRMNMCNADTMDPYNHIIAALFVVERCARKSSWGTCTRGCFVLDFDKLDFTCKEFNNGSPNTPSAASYSNKYTYDHVDPDIFKEHGKLTPGMGVLKVALSVLSNHY